MPSMGNSQSQPDDGSEDHEKYTNADQADDGDAGDVPPTAELHGDGNEPTAGGPSTDEPRKKRKKKRSKDKERVKSPVAATDVNLDTIDEEGEEAPTKMEIPAATTTIAVAGEKPRRKKKGRQTSQEEESAQALLALNKGLPAEVPVAAEEDVVVDSIAESHISPEPTQEIEEGDQDGESSQKKKRKPKHSKKKKSKHHLLPPSEPQDQEHIQSHIQDHDTQIPASPSPAPMDSPHQLDHDATLQQAISHHHQTLEHEIPDSDRIISQHLAAHMSKHAPPPPASVPDLQDVLMEDNLHFPNTLDGGISAEHMLDEIAALTAVPRKTKSGKNTYKRKRAADADDANKLVDPALRELDEATAAAAAAAAASLDVFDPSEPDSHKSKKKRRLPTEKVLSPSSKSPQKRAPRSRKLPISGPSHITTASASTGAGGTFTLEERHAIDTHLHGYMAQHALSHSDLCTRVWSNDRKKDDFWESVCSVLPQRSRASIYKHVRRSYHVFQQRAKWTAEEDEELARQVAEKGSSWKDVGDAMGRMGEDCRDRWRNYVKCGEGRGRDRWGEEEESELRRVLKEVLGGIRARRAAGSDGRSVAEILPGTIEDVDLDQPGDISGEEDINWTSVSELMGNKRSRIQCRYKWNKMKQQKARLLGSSVTAGTTTKTPGWRKRKQRVALDDMLVGDKLWLLYRIRDSGAREERNIDWDSIAEPDSAWAARDLEKAYKTLRTSQPHRRLPLAEMVVRLIAELEALPEGVKEMRFQPDAEVEAGQQGGYEDALYSGDYLSHVAVPAHNPAPVAAMGIAGQYAQHELEGMAMVDPALIGQGGVGQSVQGGGHGIQQELEKTAGEAILIAQAAVAAANAEKGRMEGEQRMEEQVAALEMEGETERELRRRLGV